MAKTIHSTITSQQHRFEMSSFEIHRNPAIQLHGFSHQEQLVYDVLCEYMHMKSHKIGSKINIEEKNGRAIRRRLTRNIILAGQ